MLDNRACMNIQHISSAIAIMPDLNKPTRTLGQVIETENFTYLTEWWSTTRSSDRLNVWLAVGTISVCGDSYNAMETCMWRIVSKEPQIMLLVEVQIRALGGG
jgi:hypothetical protein